MNREARTSRCDSWCIIFWYTECKAQVNLLSVAIPQNRPQPDLVVVCSAKQPFAVTASSLPKPEHLDLWRQMQSSEEGNENWYPCVLEKRPGMVWVTARCKRHSGIPQLSRPVITVPLLLSSAGNRCSQRLLLSMDIFKSPSALICKWWSTSHSQWELLILTSTILP